MKTKEEILDKYWLNSRCESKVLKREVLKAMEEYAIEAELANDDEERTQLMKQYGISEKNVDDYMNQLALNQSDYISKLVWGYLQYTPCKIDGKDATVIEIKHVWSLVNDIKGLLKEQQETIDINVKENMNLVKTIQNMTNRDKSSGFPLI
jgi:hypothetical protein